LSGKWEQALSFMETLKKQMTIWHRRSQGRMKARAGDHTGTIKSASLFFAMVAAPPSQRRDNFVRPWRQPLIGPGQLTS
jgi:hypothetical protein